MSDISNLLVKDTYDYVLQSDIVTGVVYRIGGAVPVNPIFSSGATFLQSLRYSDGTEQSGYVLTSDVNGNAFWGPVSGASSGNFLNLSGGTVSGLTIFQSGLTTNSFTATTFTFNNGNQQNGYILTSDINGNSDWKPSGAITGITLSGNTLLIYNNSGQTISTNGFIQKFAIDIGDSSANTITINHNFNSRDIQVEVYRNTSPWDTVFCDITRLTVNSVNLTFANPPGINEYRVVIIS
jgi:hypothetical protein